VAKLPDPKRFHPAASPTAAAGLRRYRFELRANTTSTYYLSSSYRHIYPRLCSGNGPPCGPDAVIGK
jgi:hypothetical protein